jgi:hypothetical protein
MVKCNRHAGKHGGEISEGVVQVTGQMPSKRRAWFSWPATGSKAVYSAPSFNYNAYSRFISGPNSVAPFSGWSGR